MKNFLLILISLVLILSLFSCKKSDDTGKNEEIAQTTDDNIKPIDPSIYDPNAAHGTKKLYRDNIFDSIVYRSITEDLRLMYTEFKDSEKYSMLCFDPACSHGDDSSCIAKFDNYVDNDKGFAYPSFIVADGYDLAERPVLYVCYKLSPTYLVNDVLVPRDADYVIERFDFTESKRSVIISDIKEDVKEFVTYGDKLIYTAGKSIYSVSKSGGTPTEIKYPDSETISIINIYDDKIYFSVDESVVCTCGTSLENPEKVIELASLTDRVDDAVFKYITGGYLYFIGDYELFEKPVEGSEFSRQYAACSCYRLPLDDLGKTPEKIVEGMAAYMPNFYKFSDNRLYYQISAAQNYEYSPSIWNPSDGKISVIDLGTLETKLIAENTGMMNMIMYAFDDYILFSGSAYDLSDNMSSYNGVPSCVIAYSDGSGCRILGPRMW